MIDGDYEELLRSKEVAQVFNTSVKTLWEWQKRGIIRAVRLPTGKLRYQERGREIMEAVKSYRIPVET